MKKPLTREERIYLKYRRMYIGGIVLWAIVVICIVVWSSCSYRGEAEADNEPEVQVVQNTASVPTRKAYIVYIEHFFDDDEQHPTEFDPVRDDIPLDAETQRLLYKACEEIGIQYELALAIIWQETDFRNITGDGGNSIGYMQVQPRWHRERMERLGVTDLSDPYSNFLVGLDYLSELIDRYGSTEKALVAYNQGKFKGVVTDYAKSVLNYKNILTTEEN